MALRANHYRVSYSYSEAEVTHARRLLGLDAAAAAADVESAFIAARSAISVPDGAPELAATAERLNRRLDRARAVLLAAAPPPPPTAVPPVPPTPPLQVVRVPQPDPAPGVSVPGVSAPGVPGQVRRPVSGRRRSEFSRAGVQAIAIVVGLLVLGGGAFAVTRALSSPTRAERPIPSTTPTRHAAPSTTLAARPLPARVVAGELGHPAQGIDAPNAAAALVAWLRAFQFQDATTVSLGIGAQSRLPDLAEIGSASTPSDLDAVTCNVFGSGTWVCRAGTVTTAQHKVEVAGTPEGWRVLGWYG